MAKTPLYLVGADGSEWAKRAAHRAVSLAKDTGATVHLLAVIPWSGFTPMTLEEVSQRPIVKVEEEEAARTKLLQPILDEHADKGVEITSSCQWGQPVEVMHKFAKSEKANMIFVGRRGRSRIADLLLGSVANSLAHTAGVPVVLVP